VYFLYPSNPLRSKQPDELYASEFDAVQAAGFGASVFSLEEFQAGSFRAIPVLPVNTTIIYRGWMLPSADYGALVQAISDNGAKPLTNAASYLSTHHLPNWYPLVSEFTPETRVFPVEADLFKELGALGWDGYFIKDFVKSLKTATGSLIYSPEQAATVAAEMRQFRGIIEGGFCVRRIESFLPQTEERFFVVDSIPYSMTGQVPPVVSECTRRIGSRFFSVDVVLRQDGELRIVEIGDGQVSDLVGWTPERFAKIMSKSFRAGN
jgi:hypothetical protein